MPPHYLSANAEWIRTFRNEIRQAETAYLDLAGRYKEPQSDPRKRDWLLYWRRSAGAWQTAVSLSATSGSIGDSL